MATHLSNNQVCRAKRKAFQDITNSNAAIRPRNDKNTISKRTNGISTAQASRTAIAGCASQNPKRASRQLSYTKKPVQTLVRTPIQADPHSYQITGYADDIDEQDRCDPFCVTAYIEEIYAHHRDNETILAVRPDYMVKQPYINERMRSILVDWLVEIHVNFKLVPETLYLAVHIVDRFLEKVIVPRGRLQLVGATALLIASKYEEIYHVDLGDLEYVCDRVYNKKEIIEMEKDILKTLGYKISISSAHTFLIRFLKAGHADKNIVHLSCYLLDGTLQSYKLLEFPPSQLAAAAILIARSKFGRHPWSPTLLKYTEYCEEEILPVARAILAEKANYSLERCTTVNKKYSRRRYCGISNIILQDVFKKPCA